MSSYRLLRSSDHTTIENEYDIPVKLFAAEGERVQPKAISELLSCLELERVAERLAKARPELFDETPEISRVVLTPDFHKGSGVPVGTVVQTRGFSIPQISGNDIGCGMRLHTTSLKAEDVLEHIEMLKRSLRHMFFEGGRNIPMRRSQREAMLKGGVRALIEATSQKFSERFSERFSEGLWSSVHRFVPDDLKRIEGNGEASHEASEINPVCQDYLGSSAEASRDAHIGSIGGGNHFVEIGVVSRVHERSIAHLWGLQPGRVTVMVHTGSLSVGHGCASSIRDALQDALGPIASHRGFFVLPAGAGARDLNEYVHSAFMNAANFAQANRMFLALMALSSLESTCGDLEAKLVYDVAHNFIWKGRETLHRKGACPARGPTLDGLTDTPFALTGEPVLVPGSMGTTSMVFTGLGATEALESTSHGAGRALSRGAAMRGSKEAFERFLAEHHILTPLDPSRADVRHRRDILERWRNQLQQEGPHAYKDIKLVAKTIEDLGMARPVAELEPILTIKA